MTHNAEHRFAAPHRITFNANSVINNQTLLEEIISTISGTVIGPTKASGGRAYNSSGFLIKWKSTEFVVLLKGIANIRRKQFTPDNLGLSGKSYPCGAGAKLYKDVLNQIQKLQCQQELKDVLVDLTKAIKFNRRFSDQSMLLLKSSNIIQTDFGEVLAALGRAIKGDSITFPINSNNNGVDFIGLSIPYSVKIPNGDHINLRPFAHLIKGNTPVEKYFLGCATSDLDLIFNAISQTSGICQDLFWWVNRIAGGTTKMHIEKFTTKITFNQFIDWLEDKQSDRGRVLGIPQNRSMKKAEQLWNNHSTNPFYFTLVTLSQKIWGEQYSKEISDFGRKLFKKDRTVFLTININLDTKHIECTEQAIDAVYDWKIWYIGYCTNPVSNWPGIRRSK